MFVFFFILHCPLRIPSLSLSVLFFSPVLAVGQSIREIQKTVADLSPFSASSWLWALEAIFIGRMVACRKRCSIWRLYEAWGGGQSFACIHMRTSRGEQYRTEKIGSSILGYFPPSVFPRAKKENCFIRFSYIHCTKNGAKYIGYACLHPRSSFLLPQSPSRPVGSL